MVLNSEFVCLNILELENSKRFRNLSVGEPYKKLHQLDKDCRTAYVDEHFKVISRYEVGDNSSQSQYHKQYVQYVSYFIGIHRMVVI